MGRTGCALGMLYTSPREMCPPMRHPAIKSLFTSFCKYLLAGGVGFVVDFATLFICRDLFGLHYLLAAALGFTVGLVTVYIASNKWVFDRRRMREKKTLEFSIFALIGVIGLGWTMLFMWLFVDLFSIHYILAKLVTTGLVLVWNFGARKITLYS